MPQAQFFIYDRNEFVNYILKTNFSRQVKVIQNHHTWKPSYDSLTAQRDEMYWLESMRKTHITDRKWQDIGQNITTFPSGKIAVCRPINITPAGIYGANTGAVCIEHFGNFDEGADVLTPQHKECILAVNAVLCIKFGLKPVPSQVVYHHWYDSSGKRFSESEINSGYVLNNKLQKTCPGTNFFHKQADSFKGNTILSAAANFYPLINDAITGLSNTPVQEVHSEQKKVTAGMLNVRSGRGAAFPVLRKIPGGTLVNVYEKSGDWCRVSANTEEWVSAQYLA